MITQINEKIQSAAVLSKILFATILLVVLDSLLPLENCHMYSAGLPSFAKKCLVDCPIVLPPQIGTDCSAFQGAVDMA
ncbi:hypothetical protein PM082_014689 [Marasmius tenuissimus]|nr:hypothetical protein PM082_014689 [Marasmius tenuissimus]